MSTGETFASRRFRFDKESDLALVSAVLFAEARTAKTGEVKEKFAGAFNMFLASHAVTAKVGRGVPQPKVTTFQEHYRKLIKNRGAANKANIPASGISEEYGEPEEVIDKIIEEVDIMKNEEKKKKEKEDKRQTKLKNAAEDILRKATKRLNSGESDGDEEPKPKKKPRQLVGMEALGGIDPDIQRLVEQDKIRHENEANRLQLQGVPKK